MQAWSLVVHAVHWLRKSTSRLNVPAGHRHRSLMPIGDVAFDVTVPAGHGEHCVQRLTDVSVASTSRLLDHTMIFHTGEACTLDATCGDCENPAGPSGSALHRQMDGCSSTANRLAPLDVKAMLTKFLKPPATLFGEAEKVDPLLGTVVPLTPPTEPSAVR